MPFFEGGSESSVFCRPPAWAPMSGHSAGEATVVMSGYESWNVDRESEGKGLLSARIFLLPI